MTGVQTCALPIFHLLDFVLRESAARGDGDLLLLARAEILRVDVQDAVGVDVEGHFNLRHAARRGRDVRELEFPNRLVVLGELALTLEHMNLHAGLVVARGGKNFRLARRDGAKFWGWTWTMTTARRLGKR